MLTDTYTVVFFLGLLAVVIYIASMVHKSYVLSNQMELANRARQRKLKEQIAERKQATRERANSHRKSKPSRVMARELKTVRTPWGWPAQHAGTKTTPASIEFSQSLRRFTDRLVDSKKTKEDQLYQEKRDASLRALLEDRYGRASRMTEVPYQKVKAPLLRDPNAPFDQTDSLPSSKADKVVLKLRKQPKTALQLNAKSRRFFKSEELKNVKTPWGW